MPPIQSDAEFQEASTIIFEWRLRDLRALFEASKGETKSKVTKSAMFGGGRWQVLFYANAGTANASEGNSGHISLFLLCEPTEEEKDAAMNGRWVRKGLYKFSFQIQDLNKGDPFNMKEAQNHTFSWKTANWGWAQFSRRDTVYYARPSVRNADAFLITCTISGSPEPPALPPPTPRLIVPKDLLDAVGSLLDDPHYSDVEFVLPRRGSGLRNTRRIFAMKNVLKRAEYFDYMFNGGFAEASVDPFMTQEDTAMSEAASDVGDLGARAEDSDEEDESHSEIESICDDGEPDNMNNDSHTQLPRSVSTDVAHSPMDQSDASGGQQDGEGRNVRAKLSHPSSPRSPHLPSPSMWEVRGENPPSASSSQKMRVVVKDVAYSTYRAVLYYLYTDTIVFAPLSSSFYSRPHSTAQQPSSDGQLGPSVKSGQASGDVFTVQQLANTTSRREYIIQWAQANPGRPVPCSAKAVYRIADKLDLRELKERAFEHIIKSLTVENVPYEVFSTFSATFEAVRKVEVKFFLDHWAYIRSSNAMRDVWQQIRMGRHPGFEEVWPVIATNLEFNPHAATSSIDNQST